MPVRNFLLSSLELRALTLGERFAEVYPYAWLVWEPGKWRPALSPKTSNLKTTIEPGSSVPSWPMAKDCTCFELEPKAGQAPLEVGRATDNDVVINDLTASRSQCFLTPTSSGWDLTSPGGSLRVNGQVISPGVPASLVSGDSIELGTVRLTYFDSRGMAERAARRELPLDKEKSP